MLGKSLQRVTLSQYVSYLPFKQDIFVTWIKFRFIGDLGIDVSFSIYTVLYDVIIHTKHTCLIIHSQFVVTSGTRFGEISPLWKNNKSFGQF